MARPRKSTPDARSRIMSAFASMAERMPVTGITVSAICSLAGCNKSTFYYHFETFEDLVDSYLDHMELERISEYAVKKLLDGGLESFDARERKTLKEGFGLLCHLSALNQSGIMAEKLRQAIYGHVNRVLEGESLDATRTQLIVEFASGGFWSLLAYLGRQEGTVSLDEAVHALYDEIVPAIIHTAGA